jgi:hypothetical protein
MDVKDSYNTSSDINAMSYTGLTSSGNNTGWTFSNPTLAVGKFGSQIATTTATSTDQDLGGAFTLTATGGNLTLTSLKLKHVGSFPDADIENIRLSYKNEATCSATKPAGTTAFGTIATLDENGQATTTGSISLTAGSTTCLYLVYDLSGTNDIVTLGRTVDFEITNPATDIVVAGGTVSTNSKVNINGRTMVMIPDLPIPEPEPGEPAIDNCSNDQISSVLSIHTKDETKNPTVFYLQNCGVWKKEGAGNPRLLTNPNLQVQNLSYTDMTGANDSGTIRIEITTSNMDPSQEDVFLNVTKTLRTTVGVKAWGGN